MKKDTAWQEIITFGVLSVVCPVLAGVYFWLYLPSKHEDEEK